MVGALSAKLKRVDHGHRKLEKSVEIERPAIPGPPASSSSPVIYELRRAGLMGRAL